MSIVLTSAIGRYESSSFNILKIIIPGTKYDLSGPIREYELRVIIDCFGYCYISDGRRLLMRQVHKFKATVEINFTGELCSVA